MSDQIILYGHARCPMVRPVEKMLRRANATYQYIDIDLNTSGRLHVIEINRGNQSVPTLLFPDGSTLTEPSGNALKMKLEELGYELAPLAASVG